MTLQIRSLYLLELHVQIRSNFKLCVLYDLEYGYMTLSQGHDVPLDLGQQSCRYHPKPRQAYHYKVLAQALFYIRAMWPLPYRYDLLVFSNRAKVMTHFWVMFKDCLKCYADEQI